MGVYDIALLAADVAIIIFISMGIKGSIKNVKEIIQIAKDKKANKMLNK